ncbi:MAG: choice-of-anchor Q domain-containing protein [Pyrinomonadaceae bacterium]
MNKNYYIAVCALFLLLSFAATTRATLVVNKTADTNDSSCDVSDCSLREAIDNANNDPDTALKTIIFSNLFNVPQTIRLNSELVVSSAGPLTISGPGANLLTIHMAGTDRIFRSRSTLTINGMILEFGQGRGSLFGANGKGSAIYFDGLSSGGSLTLDSVIVQNNDSTSFGSGEGSVYFYGGTNHRISNSTFTGNTSGNCGAFSGVFVNQSDTVTVVNTTISGNTVFNFGGGLCVASGTTKIRSSTIAGNMANGVNGGGGIFVTQSGIPATLDLGNTIVARNRGGNTGASNPDFLYFGGTIVTAGGNLIGDNSSVAATFPTGINPVTRDRSGDSTAPLNPLFAQLSNYGGTTPTLALSNGSPAIDNGVNIFGETPLTDQRGAARDNFIDIGAFEFNASYVGVLPSGTLNQSYNQIITQNNNGFTYCISSGALPAGLSGIPNCPMTSTPATVTITGTPTMVGTFNFAVTTTNGANSLTTDYQIIVTAPTAASVTIGGRVLTAQGRGIFRATLLLTDANGVIKYASTNPFGYFRFAEVATAQTYTLNVRHKRYQFSNETQVVFVGDEISNLIFNALP